MDIGEYPNTLADLAETDKTKVKGADGAVVSATDWHGPYIEAVPKDPVTGGAFKYEKTTGKINSIAVGTTPDGVVYANL